jgi:phosphoribosylamine--glycine ligase
MKWSSANFCMTPCLRWLSADVRFLGVGETVDLGDMYLRLQSAGHEVRVYASDEEAQDVMRGMLTFTSDWQNDLEWIRQAGRDGALLFETSNLGSLQDDLRRGGYNVIGGSELGDRLENDREFGQSVLRDLGLCTAETRSFTDFDTAIDFIRGRQARYVFKLNGAGWASTRTYVGRLASGADMIAVLAATRDRWLLEEKPSFVLMRFVEGVEVGVGAFFNGEQFLEPPNLDWEHKRFFPGDVGELTGEMGTVVTYRGAERLFDTTLARMTPMLRDSGYRGYVNLNTLVNEDGIWPIEFTCRFGYPGFAILDELHMERWDEIFRRLIDGDARPLTTRDGYAVGIVVTVPPFPYPDGYPELGKGMPVCFDDDVTAEDLDGIHFGEVRMQDGRILTAGMIGYALVATGSGQTIEAARARAYEIAGKVVIPNARYRDDIGERLIRADHARLVKLGWIPE